MVRREVDMAQLHSDQACGCLAGPPAFSGRMPSKLPPPSTVQEVLLPYTSLVAGGCPSAIKLTTSWTRGALTYTVGARRRRLVRLRGDPPRQDTCRSQSPEPKERRWQGLSELHAGVQGAAADAPPEPDAHGHRVQSAGLPRARQWPSNQRMEPKNTREHEPEDKKWFKYAIDPSQLGPEVV